MITEEQLIDNLKAGDSQALGILIEKYQDYVFTLAKRMVRSDEIAEEIAQDVFIKVYKKISSYQNRSKFTTWLFTITYRTSLNYLDKKKITITESDLEEKDSTGFINEIHFSESNENTVDRKHIIWKAIDVLPHVQGVVITLFYLNGFSVNEIASTLTLPQNTVKTLLFRGRASLKGILEKNYSKEELL